MWFNLTKLWQNKPEEEYAVRIDVNPSKKYIDIWLGQGDDPPDLRDIHSCFKGYEVVIWRSGTGNLTVLTADLLRANK